MSDETTKTIPDTSDGIMKTISDRICIQLEMIERLEKQLDTADALLKKLRLNLESKENVPQKK